MMANDWFGIFYKRPKFSGSRQASLLRLTGWSILIQCFFPLPCVFSNCQGVDIGVTIYPEKSIIRYGDPLELFCTVDGSSDDIVFINRSKILESEKINVTTKRLYIKNPPKQHGTYYCLNKATKNSCVTKVDVGLPPADVTDFNCISKNLEKLKCSWTNPMNLLNVKNTLSLVVKDNLRLHYCSVDNEKAAHCTWSTSSKPRYRQQEKTINFFMTSCNAIGCNNQSFTIDHYSVVKPDPPVDLEVKKITPHSVVLEWRLPFNMFYLTECGVEHIIEYQISGIDNTTYFHRIDASSLHPRQEKYEFLLNNLPYANMRYEVRVYIKTRKSVKREYWSDFSYNIFHTAGERPQRPPGMIAGAFDQDIWKGKRAVYVYWKQLEEYEKAGKNFTYKILYTQGNDTKAIYADNERSLTYAILRNVSLEAISVTVWSVNAIGSSLESSHIHIPSATDRDSLAPSSFNKIAFENGTYVLSWVGVEDIDNYTLLWCRHEITQICSKGFDYTVLNGKTDKYVIDLPSEHAYQFAISANIGVRSSGMVWATCEQRFSTELLWMMNNDNE